MINYFLVECDVFIDNGTFLLTDFVNLKIKSVQSHLLDVLIGYDMHAYIHKDECSYVMSICVLYCVS
jgi:hypothetical protein